MSEGASGGAAGGAAPAGGATGAAPAAVTTIPKAAPKTPPAKGAKPAESAAPEWSDADDAELFEKMKRAPWAKVKANGEEKHISSREEFLALAVDASRARGAKKVVEETNKERIEAKRIREEHAQHQQLLERARGGDQRALRELGLVPDNERAELQAKWEAMSPEQQELYRRNHELEQWKSQAEQKEKQQAEQEAAAKKKATQARIMDEARALMPNILKDVKAEMYDVELPEIIGAMNALAKTGNRIGRDYTPEQLAAYVQQRRTAALDSRVASLKPDAALRMALPHLKALVSTPEGLEQLEQVLGVDFEAVFKPISDRRLQKWRASKQKQAVSGQRQETKREEPEEERQPLSPFRYRG